MPSDTGDIPIDRVDDEKDQCVTINNKVNCRKHIANKVSVSSLGHSLT